MKKLISVLLIAVIALTICVAAESTAQNAPAQDTSPAIYVAQRNQNSVVGIITNEQTWNRQTGLVEDSPISQGSGVVIRDGGYVLTNCHVIDGGSSFKVLMPNGDKIDAELVGADSSLDLAVLQVKERSDELTPVTIGATSELVIGSTVVAIGNPGGEVLANTVTQGIISALERTSVNGSNATRQISYIQHDAAINSGNSGGGLFNYRGELVGINTLKYAGSVYSSVSFEGLGFAIPVETAADVANDLIEYGKVRRPGLGVTVSAFNGPDEPLNSDPPASVCVMTINPGSAAEQAGLRQYDFIYSVEGKRVKTLMELTGVLDSHEIGDTVEITVVRYNQAGYQQVPSYGSSYFGWGYNFGYDNSQTSSELIVGGGWEYVTVQLTLEELQ